jgi:hypothetical protein
MIIFAVLSLISILFQGIVVYLSYQLLKVVKSIRVWSRAWAMLGISMGLVALRRVWVLFIFLKETSWATGNCFDLEDRYIEVFLVLIISALWIGFIYSLKNIFVKYLGPHSGDSVLLDLFPGGTRVVVQSRENKQKSSPEDSEKLLVKILNGK